MKLRRRRRLKFVGYTIMTKGLDGDCLLGRVEGTGARRSQIGKFMDSRPRMESGATRQGQVTLEGCRLTLVQGKQLFLTVYVNRNLRQCFITS